jgi:hypothetical protein
MLAMLNPGPLCAKAQAVKKVSRNVDRTLKFYYLPPSRACSNGSIVATLLPA